MILYKSDITQCIAFRSVKYNKYSSSLFSLNNMFTKLEYMISGFTLIQVFLSKHINSEIKKRNINTDVSIWQNLSYIIIQKNLKILDERVFRGL